MNRDSTERRHRQTRRGQRGVATVEVMLSLPVILLAFGGTMFVNQQMTQWAQAERGLADIVRVCSRRDGPDTLDDRAAVDAAAIQCVEQRLVNTMMNKICPPAQYDISVERFDRVYDGDPTADRSNDDVKLASTVIIELPILKATLTCTPIIRVPLLEVDAVSFEITSAMPVRIPTDMQP